MQLIKPSQISGEIMTLVDEADKKVVLVSPYFRIAKWYKLLNKLESAKQKGTTIELYVREGEVDSIQEALNCDIQPITIPNLHTKLYLNEREAIVSSMNLLLSSDTNSLDIALKTENQKEYNDINEYFTLYIRNCAAKTNHNSRIYSDWREELDKQLFENLGQEAFINEYENKLLIQTSNKYEAFIATEKTNNLRISGILSAKEFDSAQANEKIFKTSKMEIELVRGTRNYYDTIWGTIKGIRSNSINVLRKDEQETVVNAIVGFITGVEKLKMITR